MELVSEAVLLGRTRKEHRLRAASSRPNVHAIFAIGVMLNRRGYGIVL